MPAKKKPVTKKTTKKPAKPISQQFSFSVDSELRASFLVCCKQEDTSAAREFRRFMKAYIAKHGQNSFL